LLPNPSANTVSLLAEGRAPSDELNGILVFAIVGAAFLVIIVAVWKSRIAWRLKLSWPLFLAGAVYLVGFAMLASATLRRTVLALFSSSHAWLDRLSMVLDPGHVVAYAAFTITVVMAWREKAGVLWLALALLAYGYALELLQELIPGREYGLGDVTANGLGIAIGLIGVRLFNLGAAIRNGRMLHRGHERSPTEGERLATPHVATLVPIRQSRLDDPPGRGGDQHRQHLAGRHRGTSLRPSRQPDLHAVLGTLRLHLLVGVLVTVLGCYTLHTRKSRRGPRARAAAPQSRIGCSQHRHRKHFSSPCCYARERWAMRVHSPTSTPELFPLLGNPGVGARGPRHNVFSARRRAHTRTKGGVLPSSGSRS
jgi:hypothetical protein